MSSRPKLPKSDTVADEIVFDFFFFSSRRRHTRSYGDWSSDVCSSDLLSFQACANSGLESFFGTAGANDRSQTRPVRSERSEERRVGKECRRRRSPDHKKKRAGKNPVENGLTTRYTLITVLYLDNETIQ